MRPSRRLLLLMWAWLATAVAALWPPLLPLWGGFGLALALAATADGWWLRRRPALTCRRRAPSALALAEWHRIHLTLSHPGPHSVKVEVFDHYPPSCELDGQPQSLLVGPSTERELVYRLRPLERGTVSFGQMELLVDSPMGLWRRHSLAGQAQQARVFPNFRRVAQLAMLANDARTAHMGIHLRRRRGEGTEFFQLREYRQGDQLRQIDWKAVARRHQLISREYREEQNQQVVFLLDCSRRLRSRDHDVSHFDEVLNALLLVSYVALRQGDAVGVQTFSGPEDRWLPPIKGNPALHSIMNTVFDLETSTDPSDFAEAAQRLAARQKRRALVIVITNLRDDDSSELPQALAPLVGQHLFVVASLREPLLDELLSHPVETFDDALRFCATHHYLAPRRRAHELTRRRGITVLDLPPAQLPVALVNTYHEIKRSGRL
jgi:uncharacterized protein (DUF58 family)